MAFVGASPISVRVQAQLIELSSLKVKFKCGQGAWDIQGELAKVIIEAPVGEDELLEKPLWEHKDVDIPMGAGAGVS